jgi:hypothetical protein
MGRPPSLHPITRQEIRHVLQGYTRGKAPLGLRQDDGWSFSCSPLIKHQKPSPVTSSQKTASQKPERIFCHDDHKRVIDGLCKTLFDCLGRGDAFERLDARFSELVECSIDTIVPDDIIVERVYGILIRLPWRPLGVDMSEASLK